MTTENDDFFEAPKGIKALLKEVSSIEKGGISPIPQNDEPGEDAPPQEGDLGLEGVNEEPPVTGRTAARRAETLPMGGGNLDTPPEPPKPFKIESLTSGLLEIRVGPRLYSVMGFNLKKIGSMTVTIKLVAPSHRGPQGFFLGAVCLSRAKSRQEWVQDAREILSVTGEDLKTELVTVSQAIEWLQRDNLQKVENCKARDKMIFTYSPQEADRVRKWMESRDFSERLDGDCEVLGMAGNKVGKLLLYLAATSRYLQAPLSILSVSKSGGGKSHGQQVVASLIPEDQKKEFSKITPNSFSHFNDLKNLAIFCDEISGLGSDMAPIRSLLSRGYLATSLGSINKTTGNTETIEKTVQGPISFLSSVVNVNAVDPEFRTRCITHFVPYDIESNKVIMRLIVSRETKRGLLMEPEREKIRRTYQVAQKLIRPMKISLPNGLNQYMDGVKEIRRFNNLLSLTRAIALVRIFQRKIYTEEDPSTGKVTEILEAETDDLDLASSILGQVYLQDNDFLSAMDRNLLSEILRFCKNCGDRFHISPGEVTFSRRDIVKAGGDYPWDPTKRSFSRLLEGEYLIRVSGRERSRLYFRIAKDLVPPGWPSVPETGATGKNGFIPDSSPFHGFQS